MQARVREHHLGLDPRGATDPAARGAVEEELPQRGLPDPDLTAEHEDLAAARFRRRNEAAQRLALTARTTSSASITEATGAHRAGLPVAALLVLGG